MKKLTIVFIEIGMLLGIVLAAFTVPRSFPLAAFLILSTFFLFGGNILLFRKVKQVNAGGGQHDGKFWSRIWKAFIILELAWLLGLLFR
jgi:hypothetical protein